MKLHLYLSISVLVFFIMFIVYVNTEIYYQEVKVNNFKKEIKSQQHQIDSLKKVCKHIEDVDVHIHYVYPYELY